MTTELPKGWTRCALGDVVDYGSTEKVEPDSIPESAWILELEDIERDSSKLLATVTFQDRQSKSTKNRFCTGDVLYGKLRPYLNKVIVAPSDGYCSTEIIPVRGNDIVNSNYLYWWLRGSEFLDYVNSESHGMNMPRLGTEAGRRAPFTFPPYREQKRIVAKLERLQARSRRAREALDAVPAALEKLRQSILAAAFRGDLTKDWRAKNKDVEPASKLLERIRVERRKKWEEAELAKLTAKGKAPKDDKWKSKYKEPIPVDTTDLPELPEGWCWTLPDELCASLPNALTIGPFGSDLKVEDYRDSGVPLVFVRDVRAEIFGQKGTRYIDDGKADKLVRHLARPGDLLITKMGDPPGDTAVYPNDRPPAIITADVVKLTPHPLLTSSHFLKYCLRAPAVRDQLLDQTAGVAQQKLSLERFRTVWLPVPPQQEQKLLISKLDTIHELLAQGMARHRQLYAELTALEQSILAKAFRGELVPQDPNDEPAATLLARTTDTQAPAAQRKRGRPSRNTPKAHG